MKKGFTLIELLVVVAITGMVATVALSMYSNLQTSTQLTENTTLIIQTLRTARERSLAGFNNNASGVYFLLNSIPNKYTFYQGSSYAARNSAYDREAILDKSLILSTSDLVLASGNIDINFAQGTGTPSNIGTLTISNTTNNTNKKIRINKIGAIEEN